MPSGGTSRVVLLVIFIGPYEPSLPELKLVCPEADNAENAQSPVSSQVRKLRGSGGTFGPRLSEPQRVEWAGVGGLGMLSVSVRSCCGSESRGPNSRVLRFV